MNFVYRALEYLCNKWIMRDGMMLRETTAQRGVKKQLGCSMIEVNDEIHICFPHDQWHPDCKAIYIYAKLDTLNSQLKEQSYVPDTRLVLHDVGEEKHKSILDCKKSE